MVAEHQHLTPDLSLVIPTFNERENVVPLLEELEAALDGVSWQAVFVDDSTDGTDELLAEIAAGDARVRLIHRLENRGGLAGAVVEGLAEAQGSYVCVIDADLQHPPSRILELLDRARTDGADVVIASRYVDGGSPGGLDGPMRRFFSNGLKLLSKTLFPRRLRGVTDPLGGYFVIRRGLVQAIQLRPLGYKILLEILIRCPWRALAEVPYRFEPRRHGQSKADLRQGVRFLRHLSLLVWDCSPLFALPRLLQGQRVETVATTGSART
jgi:dolichol-phosphate mannosyltransferase